MLYKSAAPLTRRLPLHKFAVDFVPKIKIEIVVSDADCQTIVDAIVRSAHTGQVGDGKIFISDIADTVRIRTGEYGEGAI